MEIGFVAVILTNLVTAVAIIATMKNDIGHLKKSDDKQENRLTCLEQIQYNHETRLTVIEDKVRNVQ